MSKLKKVEKDKATFSEREDPTVLVDRDGRDLLDAYHQAVYDILLNNKMDKTNPIAPYVKESIKKLESNSLITIERTVQHTADYFAKDNMDADFVEYKLSKHLFEWQKRVLWSMAKKITLCCGRRSGKSYGECFIAVNHCTKGYDTINGYKKPRKVAIIGLTVEKCAEVFWENVKSAAEASGMHFRANNNSYSITFKNGATIQLFGNNSKTEREKVRGTEFSLIIIDEAQSQNSLHYLLSNIFGPIIRGRDSTVILSGTGSLTGYGTWVDLTNDPNYTHFHVTMNDNPSIPEGAMDAALREEFNNDPTDVTYQREYLAEHVIDTTRMIVPKWHEGEIPDNFIATGSYIGLDYGWEDYNAIVPMVWNAEGKVYVLDVSKFNHTATSEVVDKVKAVVDSISERFKVKPIVIADNNDQSTSADIARRGVSIGNAYKVDKQKQMADLKQALGNGTIEIVHCPDLIEEFKNLVWKWDDERKSVIYDEDVDFYHGHAYHALRYAFNTYKMRYLK